MESEKLGVFVTTTAAVKSNKKIAKEFFTSSYWSWTFTIATFPFFMLGCPFHLLTLKCASSSSANIIDIQVHTTKAWLVFIFSPNFNFFAVLTSLFLLIPTFLVNAYVFIEFARVTDYLFIQAKYTVEILWEFIYLFRYIPILVPLDYIWLRGYKIRNMIQEWDRLHWKFHGYAVSSMGVRPRVILMIIAMFTVNIIRVFTLLRHQLNAYNANEHWKRLEIVVEAMLDLCLCLLIPLYCTFCYALRFQLLIIKALVYKWISEKVVPNIQHLNCVKELFTKATDNIHVVNGVFSLYLSVALVMVLVDAVSDSENVWKGVLKVLGGGGFFAFIGFLMKTNEGEGGEEETQELTPDEIREINADVAGIVIVYSLIYFMILQAVATNDTVRNINVWINDFVCGSSGTNVVGILKELGVDLGQTDKDKGILVRTVEDLDNGAFPIWARTTKLENGMDDQFIKKFHMLKSYIHVRMQTESPALLTISLVGMLVPSLSGRLRQYRVAF